MKKTIEELFGDSEFYHDGYSDGWDTRWDYTTIVKFTNYIRELTLIEAAQKAKVETLDYTNDQYCVNKESIVNLSSDEIEIYD